MKVAIVSLIIGVIIGYMGQRSRMCFIGGVRDYLIVKDTYLLKGFIGFLVTAIIGFMLLNSLGVYLKDYPWYSKKPDTISVDDFIRDKDLVSNCNLPPQVLIGIQKGVKGINIGDDIVISYVGVLAILGGIAMGFFSTLANGCPFRQHVMAASGNKSAWVYLLGFYMGILVYQYFIEEYIKALTG